ncbi:MAG: tRNA-intron lyase [Thermoplasmata archaeon]|nr:tRNA-intron lyase [Thermoplasmata archaeon]
MSIEATGELRDDHVMVTEKKQASRIYNRGYHGEPVSGGGLKLQLIEAIYLAETDRLEIYKKPKKMALPELIEHATRLLPTFEIKYIVYRDFRQRGYLVKPSSPLDFRVFERGGAPKKNLSKYWASAVSERARVRFAKLNAQIEKVLTIRKKLIIGVVDEEGDLTHYEISKLTPKGRRARRSKLQKLATPKIKAILLEDRVMIWDKNPAESLHTSEFFGKMIGEGLQISLVEAAYLLEKKILTIKDAKSAKKMSLTKFKILAVELQPEFERRLAVYKDLKKRGLIVKTGFKYGTHFRVYEGDPDCEHSEYLMHAIPVNYETSWEEISRAVRLAHGVRKEMLFARIISAKKGNIDYIRISRIRP